MKIAVLLNENPKSADFWLKAAAHYGVELEVLDLFAEQWLETVRNSQSQLFLTCPSGVTSVAKTFYDERVQVVAEVLKKKIYPNFLEIKLHENKRYLSYWLETQKIPHPRTWVFLRPDEALDFSKKTKLPIVGKLSIGASGQNVIIFRDRLKIETYIKEAFKKGISPRTGPNIKMGDWKKRITTVLKNPSHIFDRLSIYRKISRDTQRDYVYFQEYVSHAFEWRVVRIGESYFGHQKIKQGDKASGSKGIDYIPPPESLLHFVRDLCETHGFRSMAVDLFEDGRGGYLVNEMQTSFGHVQDHICEVDGKPGRYKFENNKWVFEQGFFNGNLSYNLRLEDAMNFAHKH